jgi:toxin ParE1/3/4
MRVRFTPAARAQLDAIFAYVAGENPRAARDLVCAIQGLASLVQTHPRLGRPANRRGVHVVTVSRKPYRLLYRVAGDEVLIQAVRHTSRRPLRRFQ